MGNAGFFYATWRTRIFTRGKLKMQGNNFRSLYDNEVLILTDHSLTAVR